MADEPQNEALAAELEKAGLLRDEYPDQMAQRSCTCEPDAVCGAHRLLARYDELFTAFQQSNREKREAKRALRDLALPSDEPAPPTDELIRRAEAADAERDAALDTLAALSAPPLWSGVTTRVGAVRNAATDRSRLIGINLPVPPGTAVEVRATNPQPTDHT